MQCFRFVTVDHLTCNALITCSDEHGWTIYFILQMGGCQVACSFYQRLVSLWTKTGGDKNEDTSDSVVTTADPVVAMKHESVVKIAPGKITWPLSISQDSTSPVVYIVIQEYPDRKWRQIAQVNLNKKATCYVMYFLYCFTKLAKPLQNV